MPSRLKAHILETFEAVDRTIVRRRRGADGFASWAAAPRASRRRGALAELVPGELREDYPNLPVEKAEVHLYELGPHLLSPFKPKLQDYAKKALEERDVQVHLGEGVVEVEPTRVHLKSGAEVKAHTLIWAAGLKANPIVDSLGEELVRGACPSGLI